MNTAAIILAAGLGKRMQSDLPKVLHLACGRPLIDYVLDAARGAGAQRLIVVVGHKAELVRETLRDAADVEFALQAQQRGTGHAVLMCRDLLIEHNGPVLVLAGDTPLLRSTSLARLLAEQERARAACVIGTAETDQNEGLGRIVRDQHGAFVRIVEQRDATPEQRALREINTGCYAFDGRELFAALDQVGADNDQGEYYLTDCAEILRRSGRSVFAVRCFDIAEALGVNTPEQLADVERALQRQR